MATDAASAIVAVALVVVAAVLAFVRHSRSSHARSNRAVVPLKEGEFDVIVVGASIAGCAAAKLFSDQGRKVLLLERSLSRPDRIVGELMQPGGMDALRAIGMESCAEEAGTTCTGYVAFNEGHEIKLTFPGGATGVSFHFGDFVMNLRTFVRTRCTRNVTVVEAAVAKLLFDANDGGRVVGVSCSVATEQPASTENGAAPRSTTLDENGVASSPSGGTKTVEYCAPLVVMADGNASNFKRKIARNGEQDYTPHSSFIGIILKMKGLPFETRGHVFLGKEGPMLAYRLDPNEVRMLIDYGGPTLPGNKLPEPAIIQQWLRASIYPQLPATLQAPFTEAISRLENVRSMSTPQYQMLFPRHRGVIGVGDHSNQRHPLTGGGMTCALRDVLLLTQELAHLSSFGDLDGAHAATRRYLHGRAKRVACINMLSWALYAVFGGPIALRRACFRYFFLGGSAVHGPMSMLSGLDSSTLTLFYHYYRVMFFSVFLVMLFDPSNPAMTTTASEKLVNFVLFWISPWRMWSALRLFVYCNAVFIPLFKNEFLLLWRYVDSTTH